MDKREKAFIEKIKEFMEVQDDYLNYLEEYFDFIRYRNITRNSEIEHLLDIVLGMIPTDKTVDLYTRICLYYHAIDRQCAMEYAQFYLEMYNDDTVIREVMKTEREIKKYAKK